MPCSLGTCPKEGRWRPVLELRSRKNGPITRVEYLTLAYCDGHKEKMIVADVLSDEAFVKISKNLRENGKKAPLQRNTTLTFSLIPPDELEMLAPIVAASQPPDDSLPF